MVEAKFLAASAEAEEALQREGRTTRLLSVKSRLPDARSRRIAPSMAIRVIAADGIIRSSHLASTHTPGMIAV